MTAIIFNDLHIGVKRTGGTTPRTAFALRNWLRGRFEEEIMQHTDKHLFINGDCLDNFEVDTSEVIQTVNIFKRWLDASSGDLYLGGGNHDFSAKADRISSFELLCHILTLAYPSRVTYYMDGLKQMWNDKVWIIPHQLNQDLFDMELDDAISKVPSGSTLFLHCNYDNQFAVHSDHSLNLSREKAIEINDAGIKLVIAHEHIKRVLRKDRVYITGNQFPTSVSDCLDPNGAKFAHVINPEGDLTPIETWSNEGGFIEVEWTQLNEVRDELFVRVSGNASQASAEEAITAISKFRSTSTAFVITNAIKVEGMEGFEEVSLEDIKGFDVASALLEKLEPKEQEIIKNLLEGRNEQ